ncbi:DUF7219 family protein [Aliinostoc sp. HNIBRCY26]|uniref:DUF7219 family protein n=1 Tax=Aliinostoc sp. HNIBRCY26 TaxID=3418997 RepID=UPI003D015DF6
MEQKSSTNELNEFLYNRSPYYGQVSPEYISFNHQLQDFSQRVNYICSLQTGGKISLDDAYKQIKSLWKKLKVARQVLNIK